MGMTMKSFDINYPMMALSCAVVIAFYIFLQLKSYQAYQLGKAQYNLLATKEHKMFSNVVADGYGKEFVDLVQDYDGKKSKYIPFLNCDRTDVIVVPEAIYLLAFNTKRFANPFTGYLKPIKLSFNDTGNDTDHLISYKIEHIDTTSDGDLYISLKHKTFKTSMAILLFGMGFQFKQALREMKKQNAS